VGWPLGRCSGPLGRSAPSGHASRRNRGFESQSFGAFKQEPNHRIAYLILASPFPLGWFLCVWLPARLPPDRAGSNPHVL